MASVCLKRCVSKLADPTSRHFMPSIPRTSFCNSRGCAKSHNCVFPAPATLVHHVRQHAPGVPACLHVRPTCQRQSTHGLEVGHPHQLPPAPERPVKLGAVSLYRQCDGLREKRTLHAAAMLHGVASVLVSDQAHSSPASVSSMSGISHKRATSSLSEKLRVVDVPTLLMIFSISVCACCTL